MSELFDLSLIRNARWDELFMYLTKGNPPLIVLLLVINTIFFVLYVTRKATSKHRMRPATVYAVQALMVGANAVAIFKDDAWRYVNLAQGIF